MASVFVTVKATHNSEMRRLDYKKHQDIRYNDLYLKLSRLFNISSSFQLSYINAERLEVTVKSDADIQQAIEFHRSSDEHQRVTVRLRLSEIEPSTEPLSFFNESLIENDKPVARAASTSTTLSESPEIVHYNVICDTCSNVIKGIRWKCRDCTDYDMCTDCKRGSHMHNPAHDFQAIYEPQVMHGRSTRRPMVPSATSSEPFTPGLITHEGVMCDICYSIVRGMRWKCNDCPDFDLCQNCKSGNSHRHPAHHNFKAIPYPQKSSQSHDGQYHSAQCDFCELTIKGIRHKCLQCPDFDICDGCIALAEIQHPEHTFVQILRPGYPEIKPISMVAHPGIRCDGCNKTIFGVRYKCVNCQNFDFCGNCEANPFNKHDPTHLFLKIKKPLPRPIASQKPLLRNFYSLVPQGSYNGHGRNQRWSGHYGPSRCGKSSGPPPICTMNNSLSRTPSTASVSTSTNNADDIVKHESLNTSKMDNTLLSSSLPPLVNTFVVSVESSKEADVSEAVSEVVTEYVKPNLLDSLTPIVTDIPQTAALSITISEPVALETAASESATVNPSTGNLSARFLEDINIEDGTIMEPKARFLKIWKMVNDGMQAWPQDIELRFCGGDRCFNDSFTNESPTFKVPPIQPGQDVTITADLQAPAIPGRYVSYWRLLTPDGTRFGHRVWCDIIVEEVDASSTSSSMIFPTISTQQVTPKASTDSILAFPILTSPTFTPTTVHSNLEDPFRDPPRMSPSLASSVALSAHASELDGDEDDNATVVSVSARSNSTGIHISAIDDDSDDQDDVLSTFSDLSSRISYDDEFIMVRDDVPSRAQSIADDQDLEQSVQIAKAPLPISEPEPESEPELEARVSRLIIEESDLAFGSASEIRPLMEDFGVDEYSNQYENQMKQLSDMGFDDAEVNKYLLTAFNGNIEKVMEELLSK